MSDDVEPVPAVHEIVTCVFPGVADMPVGADGGGSMAHGVTLFQVWSAALFS
jgi:hypothetical protein